MEQILKNRMGVEQPIAPAPDNGVANAVVGSNATAQQDAEASLESFNEKLSAFFGGGFDIYDKLSQDLLLKHLEMNREQNEHLAQMLERDPRLAQMLVDIIDGKRGAHSAVARYFGRGFVGVDEDSPEYEEIMLADEERKNEVMRLASDRREYESNLEASMPVIESFCYERGYDPSDFMDKVWENLIFPIMAGKYTTDVCTALDHAITYEQDVEDAFAAGDVKGRNSNIRRMREDFGDGLPKGMSSVAPDLERKRPRNSLIEKALNA
ncbi:MAG: hypothetical protein J6Q73_03745 [Bacteroidaceae bacterium]|nr:hypothetical protein [Bacteroidaceae bacterium]